MPQQEGETDYKYEDYASEVAVNRLPPTTALVDQIIKITLDSGTIFDIEFFTPHQCNWQSGQDGGTDWYEAIEVGPQIFFIDITFTDQPRQSQTFIVNTKTRQVLAVRTIMREGDVGDEPRAQQIFDPGVLGDPSNAPKGNRPSPTRDLIGLRGL